MIDVTLGGRVDESTSRIAGRVEDVPSELVLLSCTAASLYMIGHTRDYERLEEKAETIERRHIPDYLTERER